MFLTAHTIRRLIAELDPPLIDIIIPKELEGSEREALEEKREGLKTRFIEGSCFDLELTRIEIQADDYAVPMLGRDERNIPGTTPLLFTLGKPKWWRLQTEQSYLCQSLEVIICPPWLMPQVHMRTSVFRGRGAEQCTFVKPGYKGNITTEVHMIRGYLDIQKTEPFCSVAFALMAPDAFVRQLQREYYSNPDFAKEVDLYKGIWGGDKLTTEGKTERGF